VLDATIKEYSLNSVINKDEENCRRFRVFFDALARQLAEGIKVTTTSSNSFKKGLA
jgi:hypothetical protein